jgi:hypothetical protein
VSDVSSARDRAPTAAASDEISLAAPACVDLTVPEVTSIDGTGVFILHYIFAPGAATVVSALL